MCFIFNPGCLPRHQVSPSPPGFVSNRHVHAQNNTSAVFLTSHFLMSLSSPPASILNLLLRSCRIARHHSYAIREHIRQPNLLTSELRLEYRILKGTSNYKRSNQTAAITGVRRFTTLSAIDRETGQRSISLDKSATMTTEEGTFKTRDGTPLYTKTWKVSEPILSYLNHSTPQSKDISHSIHTLPT
ncbi:hypothetical protein ES702_00269 [subsurface metagenome]